MGGGGNVDISKFLFFAILKVFEKLTRECLSIIALEIILLPILKE